jgi:phosphate ABC transporter permease subunit PstA
MARVISKKQAQDKAQQGVFFITMASGATLTVLAMLFALLVYMLYQGSSRLFYSPVYELTFADGSKKTTAINEELEFDVIGPDGHVEPRSAIQSGKFFAQRKAEACKYAQAPIGKDITIQVWEDQVSEEKDPFAEEETTVKIKMTKQVLKEQITGATDVRYDLENKKFGVTLADGSTREFGGNQKLSFKRADEVNPLNWETLVTRYLHNEPAECEKRIKAGEARMELTSGTLEVDPRWAAWRVRHEPTEGTEGRTFLQEKRVEQFPAVASFRILERWNWFQFFWDSPRSSNTAGGVFPCIFGTVLMTLIMTLFVAPLGVATAIFLREYARDNWFTRLIRMAVANLAGVPSIVFGLFGLGFFVMTVGGGIDGLFFGGNKTYGTPCVLWASMTMALLTLPVMIVTCEEALRTVPKELREGAMALGATKFSTILTVVVPAALPGILTGVILAIARGAGEVAPLLLTGVVAQKDKLPSFSMAGMRETFMNLAYHVYDLSVKSPPNKIEEAQALAFSAALVLLLVVLAMNLLAIWVRARLSRIKMA